ncbi:MAG: nucleotide exchange factor GrpE [Flavobacteriales bacterium]|nr:nucleotide exchange factor GrpE [Flavobacteriales bacterium]
MEKHEQFEKEENKNFHEEVNTKNEIDSEENEQKEEKPTPSEDEKKQEESDRYFRLYSEFENFRKRTQKEKLDLYKTAGEEILSALLPIVDDFERAIKANQTIEDINSIKEGFSLIHEKLFKTLKQKGLEAIQNSVGEKLNIELHEAITQIPAPTEEQKGLIIDELEKGYLLNGKVIRFTKVVVGF